MRRFVVPCMLFALCGCAVGPQYVRPETQSAKSFKEIQGWKLADPNDVLPRGSWWSVYQDPTLDQLMKQIDISNQTVKQAEAQYRSARAAVLSARAAYFPTISANTSATRSSGASSRFVNPSNRGSSSINNTYNLSLDATWELDVWGRLRRLSESAQASAGASAADLESARLSAQAELAQDYFQLRVTDAEKAYLDDEVGGFEKSLKITQNQYAVGVAKRSDVLQAETQLKSTRAQALDLQITRAQLEHAIAVLLGKNPSNFSLEPAPLTTSIPAIPVGLPSQLLERRPDIAAAERRVIAANAQIGVARAAYFPSLSLAGTLGYQSTAFEHLVSAANRVWSVGPSLALTLFDAGSHIAASRQARANYEATVAAYRDTTLAAFRDVEDNLVALRVLGEEQGVQDDAAKAAADAANIALNQYKAGTVSYLDVVVAQSTALTNARNSLNIRGRNLVASVALIRALGGGWSMADELR
jgi:NodT family efflux transporter outer membrane factor (OMF) lipoprotein